MALLSPPFKFAGYIEERNTKIALTKADLRTCFFSPTVTTSSWLQKR